MTKFNVFNYIFWNTDYFASQCRDGATGRGAEEAIREYFRQPKLLKKTKLKEKLKDNSI